jgi:hypothetical protein
MRDARIRLSLVRPGRGRLVRVLPADPYAFETVAADARSLGPDGYLEVRWDGPPSEHGWRVRDLLARLAARGANVRWTGSGEAGEAPPRAVEPSPTPDPTPRSATEPPALYRVGDLVSPADLPGSIACRIIAAEPCVGTAVHLLILEPLEGPWPLGTRLLRTSDAVARVVTMEEPSTLDDPTRSEERALREPAESLDRS